MAEREERSDPKEPSSAKAEGAKADDEVQKDPEATKAEAEEDDDEECGFCKFMKAGPCGEVFEAWETCIDNGRKEESDYVESCMTPTRLLKECMEKHPEYYGPMLEMEREEQKAEEGEEAKHSEEGQPPEESK